ncbi:SidA/IucD/PvdA family monooxygenase [Streptomyces sp. M10(2022)]
MTDRHTPSPTGHTTSSASASALQPLLAALARPAPALSATFYEQRPAFHWHPGLLIDGATLQVPSSQTSSPSPTRQPLGFLNYLRTLDRLYPSTSPSASTSSAPNTTPTAAGPANSCLVSTSATRSTRSAGTPTAPSSRSTSPNSTPKAQPKRSAAPTPGTSPSESVPNPSSPNRSNPRRSPGRPRLPRLRLPPPPRTAPRRRTHHSHRLRPVRRRNLPRPPACPPAGAERSTGSPAPRPSHPWSTPNSASNNSPRLHPLFPRTPRIGTRPAPPSPVAAPQGHRRGHHQRHPRRALPPHPPRRLAGRHPHPGVRVRTAGRLANNRVELHLEHIQQATRTSLSTDAVVLATGYRERPSTAFSPAWPHIRRDASQRPASTANSASTSDPPSPATSTYRTPSGTPTASAPQTSD